MDTARARNVVYHYRYQIWEFLAFGSSVASFVLCLIQKLPEHGTKYLGALILSLLMTVVTFAILFKYADLLCFQPAAGDKIEKWAKESWLARSIFSTILTGLGIGMNFLLVDSRFKLWVMVLHTCAIFFLWSILNLRIPFDLVGLWIGCTATVAWDPTRLLTHAFHRGDYITSGIVSGLLIILIIFQSYPHPVAPASASASRSLTSRDVGRLTIHNYKQWFKVHGHYFWGGGMVVLAGASTVLCTIQEFAIAEHLAARYIGPLIVSVLLILIPALIMVSNIDQYCFHEVWRTKTEEWGKTSWLFRFILNIFVVGLGVGLNFLLVQDEYKIWVLGLHTGCVFCLGGMLNIRTSCDLGGPMIGFTAIIAWDASQVLYHSVDYTTSGIVSGFLFSMIIVRAYPSSPPPPTPSPPPPPPPPPSPPPLLPPHLLPPPQFPPPPPPPPPPHFPPPQPLHFASTSASASTSTSAASTVSASP
ncbi:hypothetical protein LINGRAHAP2_LOCUS13133, partial [Linum grandiflorum]